jgi:hypothetical protein
MKKELLITASVLFSFTSAAPALAMLSGTPQEAEDIRSALVTRNNDLEASQMWSRIQQNKLKRNFQQSEAAPLQLEHISANTRAEKCFPWAWEGGQRSRIAVATASQVCLKSKLDPSADLSQMGASIDAMNDNLLFVFDTQFEILRARAEATMPMQGSTNASGNVSILSQQVWTDFAEAPSLKWNKIFNVLNFDKSKAVPFMIGPIPASATIGARGTVSTAFEANLNVGNGNIHITPSVDLDGYAFGGVDLSLVKGKIEAALEILKNTVDLKAAMGLTVNPVAFPPQLTYAATTSGHNSFSAINGDVVLLANTSFEIPSFGNEFRFPLVSYLGFKASGFIFSEKIDPTPVQF